MKGTTIDILIVDDSIFFREFMRHHLSAQPNLNIVGMAGNAEEAMTLMQTTKPDVMILDIEMPKMRGTEFLKQFHPKHPHIPVIVVSSVSANVFEALDAGAVDFVSKPAGRTSESSTAFIADLLSKLRIASTLKLSRQMRPLASAPAAARAVAHSPAPAAPAVQPATIQSSNKQVIAIGASTGGTEAILAVLREMPVTVPGIVIVQHMPPVFTRMYAERLNNQCQIEVREAVNGDKVRPGLALIAPGGTQHMRLHGTPGNYTVRLQAGEKVSGHCPSVDVLFESVAKCAGKDSIGVLLTGMGADGAKNLLAMRKAGAYTIGQDQATSVVYGMPMVAYNLGAVAEQAPLENIRSSILKALTK